MRQRDILKTAIERAREATRQQSLSILETGSIRAEGDQYRQGDGWSTLTFADEVAQNGGTFMSVDLDISVAHKVLTGRGMRTHVELTQGHSVDVMTGMAVAATHRFDLILLDSDNSGDLILCEYLIARYLLNPGGVVVVDDVEPGSDTVVKGAALLPWLDRTGTTYQLLTRQGNGFSTGMLVI